MGKKLSLIVSILLVNVCSLAAAEPTLSLTDAVQMALNNNDQIKAARAYLDAGREDVRLAQSAWQPKVALEEQFIHTNNPGNVLALKMDQKAFSGQDLTGAPDTFNDPSYLNDFQTTLSVNQLLLSKKADLGTQVAQQEFAAKEFDFSAKQQEVAFSVIKSYLAVYTAGSYIQVTKGALEDARAHQAVSQARYEGGLGLYSDLLRTSTAVTEAEEREVSAEKNYNVAKRQLGLLLGLGESANISGALPEPKVKDIDYYYQMAKRRPDIKALELRNAAAQNGIALADADKVPVLLLNAAYQLNDPHAIFGMDGKDWQVAAIMRWNLFDGATGHQVKKAGKTAQETAESVTGLQKEIAFQVYEAYLSVEEAAKNIELAKSAVAAADEGRRLVEERYQNSLSPIVDLLDAQLNLDRARANLVERRNAYQEAVAALNYRSGILLSSVSHK